MSIKPKSLKNSFPGVDFRLKSARVWATEDRLHASTGSVERVWAWVPGGVKTVGLTHRESGKSWVGDTDQLPDWDLESLRGSVVLEDFTVLENDDEGLTQHHLQVDVLLRYLDSGCQLIYRIWCYPDAPGIRTQLLVRGDRPVIAPSSFPAIEVTAGSWKEHAAEGRPRFLTGVKMVGLKLTGLVPGGSYILAIRLRKNDDGSRHGFKLQTVDGERRWIREDGGLVQFVGAGVPGLETVSFRIPVDSFPDGTCDMFISQSGSQVFVDLFDACLLAEGGGVGGQEPVEVRGPSGYGSVSYLREASGKEDEPACTSTVERMGCDLERSRVSFVGYLSDTQRLNSPATELLRSADFVPIPAAGVENHWASIMLVEDGQRHGMALVKESHKCVNTPGGGANTGGFRIDPQGVEVTGAGWTEEQLQEDRWHACWATWLVLYAGGQDEMSLALKKFDRLRYPIHPEIDVYIMANTWGGGRQQAAAVGDNVLKEMRAQADLGIDVQQIDDGWQGLDYVHWVPAAQAQVDGNLVPSYPDGWIPTRKEAERLGLKLGLWFASNICAQDLLRNWKEGGFQYFKLDFGNFTTMDQVDRMEQLLRKICRETGFSCRVNWDVTEVSPRSGYFWGREFGNIYLENRSSGNRPERIYHPYLVLRDAWHLAHYLNLNQFQLTVQNGDLVGPAVSDACRHDPAYLLAQTLMGIPLFFQETQLYSDHARAKIKSLIAIYKKHRQSVADGYVFPLGEKPDNASWSGFQCVRDHGRSGYLTLFRQINNGEPQKKIFLKFLAGKGIAVTDLVAGETWERSVGPQGEVSFDISQAPGFVFCSYSVLENR